MEQVVKSPHIKKINNVKVKKSSKQVCLVKLGGVVVETI